MKIKIISREIIKPSSPTPNHLRNYKLSVLDQLVRPCVYPSMLFFYPKNHIPTPQRLHKLKNSLSETLTRFYPLAGRIKDNISIECHDDGALYIEARVHGFLLDFLKLEPHSKQRERLLPDKTEFFDAASPPLLLVQASFFECGGLAIGFYMCHKFGDAGTQSRFIKDWAFIASGHEEVLQALDLDAGSFRFPPSIDFKVQEPPAKNLRSANHVTKRYVFDARKIAALKAKAASQFVQQPTRTEAILALIWRCAMSASRLNKGVSMQYVMHQLMNIRNRVEPPFPENSIGNFVQYFSVQAEEVERELQDLVALLRKGIKEFGEKEAKRLSGEHAFGEIIRSSKERREISGRDNVRLFTCTSLCSINFFYEVYFGWGKPIWLSIETGSNLNNFALLANTRDGNGVEAWVTLSEEEMKHFESDPELLAFASLNPSVSLSRL